MTVTEVTLLHLQRLYHASIRHGSVRFSSRTLFRLSSDFVYILAFHLLSYECLYKPVCVAALLRESLVAIL